MKRQSKFESRQQPQARQLESEQQAQQPAPLEFATPEEMLRYDAARTEVPATVAQRLQKSVAESGPPRPRWWRRLFGTSRS
jgi:hypothetical protein